MNLHALAYGRTPGSSANLGPDKGAVSFVIMITAMVVTDYGHAVLNVADKEPPFPSAFCPHVGPPEAGHGTLGAVAQATNQTRANSRQGPVSL